MVGFDFKHQNLPQEAVDFAAMFFEELWLRRDDYGEIYLENLSSLLFGKSCQHRTVRFVPRIEFLMFLRVIISGKSPEFWVEI